MRCDIISCVIYIFNKNEYLEKEESYRNPTIEVTLLFQVAMQSRSCWSKFNVIGTLNRPLKSKFQNPKFIRRAH